MKTSHPDITVLLALAILLGPAASLPAATRAKANNADNLNLASSWTNNLPPGTADVALFDSTVTAPITVALGADLAWNQINFVNPGGDVTFSAGNRLTLSNNTPITFGPGTANLTLECDLYCAGASFTTLPAAPTNRTVTYNGAIQGRNITGTLGNNTGTLRLGSSASTQIGSVVQVTTANLKLGIGASSIGDPIASGPLGTNLFTWGATSTGTELFAYNGDQTLGNPVRIQFSPLNFNSADDLTLSGVTDLNNGSRTINVSSNGALRLTGIISNGTAIVKTGAGTLELGGTNIANWNNGLSVFGGGVRLLANDVLPDGAGKGTLRMTNTAHLLDLNGFSDTLNGMAGSGGVGNWVGTLDNTAPSTTSVLTVGDDFTYTLLGVLQNTGPGSKLALVKAGTGGLIISNANTFSGGIINISGSQIFLNAPGAAGTGPIVIATTNTAAEIVYNIGSGTLTLTNDLIVEAGAQPAFYAAAGGTLELAGLISGLGAVRRTDSGTGGLILSGDNTYTGGFTLQARLVALNHPRALGRGTFNLGSAIVSGTFLNIVPGVDLSGANSITNSVMINRDFTIGGIHPLEFAGPVVWITNSTQRSINVTNPAGVVISGPMSGYGFNKTGQGSLTLNGVCSHNGPSTISTGPFGVGPGGSFTGATTILVGQTGLLDVSTAVNFTVATNQTLRGSGSVKGNMTVNGTLDPGDLIFTLTISNNITMSAGSTTTLRVSRDFASREKLICHGTLTYGGNLVVNNLGPALQAGDTLDLFGFAGNPGSFASLTLPTLDAGLAWDITNLSVDGTIRVVSTAVEPPQLSNPQLLDSTNFVMTVTGGTTNGQFRVLSQTNVTEPLANWEILSTNDFDGSGNLTLTNLVNPAEPQRFFRVVQP